MAKNKNTHYISFDASIKEGYVGIGIFNNNNGDSLHYKFKIKMNSSRMAEEMALLCAIKYANDNYIATPFFFTDNLPLFNDINENQQMYIDKYSKIMTKIKHKKRINIHWIPREINTEADKLSKIKCKTVSKKSIKSKSKKLKNRNEILKNILKKKDDKKYSNKFANLLATINDKKARTLLRSKYSKSEKILSYIDYFFLASTNNQKVFLHTTNLLTTLDKDTLEKDYDFFLILNFLFTKKSVKGQGKKIRFDTLDYINNKLGLIDIKMNKAKNIDKFFEALKIK